MKRALLILCLMGVAWAQPAEEVLTVKKIQLQKADGTFVTLSAEEVEQLKTVLANQEKLNKLILEIEEATRRNKVLGILIGCKSNLKNLATACEMYASDNGGRYPKAVSELVEKNYLRRIPKCPLGGDYQYSVKLKPDSFIWICPCEHTGTDTPKGYPRYNAEQGLIERP